MIKKTISVLLMLAMVISMTACFGRGVASYRAELSKIIEEVEELNPQIEDAVADIVEAMNNLDGGAYQETLETLRDLSDKLKEKYNAIANTEAPSEYADDQSQMQRHAADIGDMLDASMEIYELMYDFIVNGELSEEILARLEELQNTVMEKSDATADFDDVLNRIMGYTED